MADELRIKCEVWSRCVGYLRPVSGWNVAKRAEFRERTLYDNAVKEQAPPAFEPDAAFQVGALGRGDI